MHRVAFAALALLLALPSAQALSIQGPEDVVAFADHALEIAMEESPVPVESPAQPPDPELPCIDYMSGGDPLTTRGEVCSSPSQLSPTLFGGDGPADGNATAQPEAAQPASGTLAEAQPAAAEETAFEAPMASEPAPQPTPFAPGPRTSEPAPPPAADLRPVPAPSPAGGLTTRLLALTAAAAAAVVPSLALKLASLLALRRGRRKDSPLRAAILALLEAEPGLHHTELVRRIGHGNGTVEHHVLALVREGLVTRLRTPGYTCYFPAGAVDPAAARARVAVRSRTSRALLSALAEAPGPRSLSELAADLDVALSTAHYHASRLAAAGLLADERLGARRGLGLTALGRSLAQGPEGMAGHASEAPVSS